MSEVGWKKSINTSLTMSKMDGAMEIIGMWLPEASANRTFTAYRWWRNSHQILAFWSIAHIYKQRDMYVVTMCCRHKPLIIIHVKSSFQNCLEHANKMLARPTLLNANSLKEYFGGATKSISMKFSRHPFQSTENRWNNIQFWCNETDWVFKVDWKKKKIIQPCLVITLDY